MLAAGVAPPAVEVAAGNDVLRDASREEVVKHLIGGKQSALPRALLERLDLGDAAPVFGDELVARVPLAVDQRAADEQLARQRGVDATVVDAAAGDDRQTVERHALGRHDAGAVLVPAWLGDLTADEAARQRLDPAA